MSDGLTLAYDDATTQETAKVAIQGRYFFKMFQYEEDIIRILENSNLPFTEARSLLRQFIEYDESEVSRHRVFHHLNVDFENNLTNFIEFLRESGTVLDIGMHKRIADELKNEANVRAQYVADLKERYSAQQTELNETNQRISDAETNNRNLQQELETKQADLTAINTEYQTLKENHITEAKNVQNALDVLKAEENRYIKQDKLNKFIIRNLNDEKSVLEKEINFRNREEEYYYSKVQDENDKTLCCPLLFNGYYHKFKKTGRFELLFYTFILLIGAITIGGALTGPPDAALPFAHDVLYKVLPFFTASLGAFIVFLCKLFCDKESPETFLFVVDKRIMISSMNFVCGIIEIFMYFFRFSPVALVLYKSLLGLPIGVLSVLIPTSLCHIGVKTQPAIMLLSYVSAMALGVFIVQPLRNHWMKFFPAFPFAQMFLVWAINRKVFRFLDLDVDFIEGFKFHLEPVVVYLNCAQPFFGSFTIWFAIQKLNYETFDLVYLGAGLFCGSFLFVCLVLILQKNVFKKIEQKKDYVLIGLIAPSIILEFVGLGLCLGNIVFKGLLIACIGNGFGLMLIIYLPYLATLTRIRPKTFAFNWTLFWFSTGFCTILITFISFKAWLILSMCQLFLGIAAVTTCILLYMLPNSSVML